MEHDHFVALMRADKKGVSYLCSDTDTGGLFATETFGPNGLLSRHVGGQTTYYTFDATGNLSQRLDTSGAVMGTYRFDAFGNQANTTGSTDPFGGYGAQSGYFSDWETGLQRCGLRYYDKATGRFLTRDPIGYAGGLNVYGYCGNNPVNFADPLGLWATGSYLGDVGQVFAGYGSALNPANWWHGFEGMVNQALDCGIGSAVSSAANGLAHGLTNWMTTNDPCAFGNSFGNTLMVAGAAAAPFAGGGAAGGAAAAGAGGRVMRVVSAAEADAINEAGGFVSSNGRNMAGMTRVFEPEGLEPMSAYGRANGYTHLVEMPVTSDWGGAIIIRDGAPGMHGWIVDVDTLNATKAGPIVITPL